MSERALLEIDHHRGRHVTYHDQCPQCQIMVRNQRRENALGQVGLQIGQQRQLWTGPEDELDQRLVALPAGYCYVSTITRHQVTLWVKREA